MDDRVVDPPLPPRAALRWSIVRQIIAEQQPETILELGCGLGSVGARLARMATYTAVEPDPRSYHVARQRITPLGGTVCNGDHRQAPTPGRYDLVCAFEVLEHLADDAAALAEWLPLVRPGGRLLLSVPADPDRFGSWDVLVGHYRRYSAEQLRQRLAEAGATQIRIVHYGWPLGYLLDEVRNRWARGRGRVAGRTVRPRSGPRGPVVSSSRGARSSGGSSGWRCRRSPRSSGCDRTAVRDSSRWPPAPGDTWSASAGRTPVFPVAVRPGWSAGEPGGGAGGTRRPDRRSRRRRRACRRRALSHGARSVTVRAQSRCAADRRAATGTRA